MHVTPLLLCLALFNLVSCAVVKPELTSEAGPSSVDIFAVNFPVVAYVLESKKDVATTYLVACPKGVKTESCDFKQPYTLVEGPKTARWDYAGLSSGATDQVTLDCKLEGTTSMGCTASGHSGEGKTTTEMFVWTGKAAATLFRNVALVTDTASLLTHTAAKTASKTTSSCTTTSTTSSESTAKAPITTPPPRKSSTTSIKISTTTCSTTATTSQAIVTSAPVKEVTTHSLKVISTSTKSSTTSTSQSMPTYTEVVSPIQSSQPTTTSTSKSASSTAVSASPSISPLTNTNGAILRSISGSHFVFALAVVFMALGCQLY